MNFLTYLGLARETETKREEETHPENTCDKVQAHDVEGPMTLNRGRGHLDGPNCDTHPNPGIRHGSNEATPPISNQADRTWVSRSSQSL